MSVAGDTPLIRLRGVTKVYGEGALAFQALKGVDLDIAQGDFVAIMGPSGSGKSTAMNTLGCLDRPTTGEYLFKGVHEMCIRDRRKRVWPPPPLLSQRTMCVCTRHWAGVGNRFRSPVAPLPAPIF